MLDIRYYVAAGGDQPFADWYAELEAAARAKVARAIVRLGQGNLSNVKSVGGGVLEYRIEFGPGYRVYFGRDGETLVILLTGGTKRRQQRDIDTAFGRTTSKASACGAEGEMDGKNKELQGTRAEPRKERQEICRSSSARRR
jgi:putative addiction module killer protein